MTVCQYDLKYENTLKRQRRNAQAVPFNSDEHLLVYFVCIRWHEGGSSRRLLQPETGVPFMTFVSHCRMIRYQQRKLILHCLPGVHLTPDLG